MSNVGKRKAVIVGPGNIGTDLLIKMLRSDYLDPVWMIGIEDSEGIRRAREFGLHTSTSGVKGLLPYLENQELDIAFDATSAHAHLENAAFFKSRHITTVDLTPAAIGAFCIPSVNLDSLVGDGIPDNVNMVTCGGQATVPLVAAISRVQEVRYAEIVATVASTSIGQGTRQNIDEFTRTTAKAIADIGGARESKAIIIINPADPPLIMRNTVHCLTEEAADPDTILPSIDAMVNKMQVYVPGYQLERSPVIEGKRVSCFISVRGLGDFLPDYSGNLDIMTAAALRTGELLAMELKN